MKIKETAKCNIQITMSKEQAYILYKMLDNMTLLDIGKYTKQEEAICDFWYLLEENHYML